MGLHQEALPVVAAPAYHAAAPVVAAGYAAAPLVASHGYAAAPFVAAHGYAAAAPAYTAAAYPAVAHHY